jgi:hypothetical protein
MPTVPVSLIERDQRLGCCSIITTAGAAQTMAARELRVECPLPGIKRIEINHVTLKCTA